MRIWVTKFCRSNRAYFEASGPEAGNLTEVWTHLKNGVKGTWKKENNAARVKVAIKVVNEQTASADFITNFLPREIEISRKIEHRNLLKTMLYFSFHGKTYIVTELARFDLLQYLRLKGSVILVGFV